MPDVSVIIVTWNGKALLRDCLRSLASCTLRLEVIVADNGSEDGSIEMLRSEFPGVTVIRYSKNERFALPNNEGMRRATGRHILLLNNDTVVHPGAIERLVSVMDANPRTGMVGARLIGTDGKTQFSCHGIVTPLTHLFDVTGLDRLFPGSRFFAAGPATFIDYSSPQEVDHVMAAAVLVRREALEDAGAFDEHLTIYYNDLDLSLRFRQAGWATRYEPDAAVTHIGGATTAGMRFDRDILSEQYANILHYFRKHYGRLGVLHYRVLLAAGFIARAAFWSLRAVLGENEQTRWRRLFSYWSIRVACFGPGVKA